MGLTKVLALEDFGGELVDVDDDTLATIDEALAQAERGETADPVRGRGILRTFSLLSTDGTWPARRF